VVFQTGGYFMQVLFVSILLAFSASTHAASGDSIPWDHTPFYFLSDTLPVDVNVREFPMLGASHWRVCRAMNKKAFEIIEQMNNPRVGDQIVPLRHEFVVLRSNCSVQATGASQRSGAMRMRTFSGEVHLNAVSSNFVPGFNKARSVEVLLIFENGEAEKLAELSPGTVYDIPSLQVQKSLRLTEIGQSIVEQFVRPGQELKFKINSSYPSHFLEVPAQDLVSKSKTAVRAAPSEIETCASQVDGR
jgi:hypothetical protein